MARMKNALRGHFVAPYTDSATAPAEGSFLELAKWITDVEDATDEQSEDYADFAGDGTLKTEVTGVKGAYNVTGTYDPEDEAQALIVGMKYEVGEGRKVWHKVVHEGEAKEYVGVATVTAIIGGSGNAADFEAFGCTIAFDTIPEITPSV